MNLHVLLMNFSHNLIDTCEGITHMQVCVCVRAYVWG